MPWKETHVEEQRRQFIEQWLADRDAWTMEQLCGAFGVSRKTGYKWVERFKSEGMSALSDRSRARHTQGHATAPEVVEKVVELRREHPRWGARKLLAVLDVDPTQQWPAPSTVGDILKRQGMIQPRRRRARATPTERAEFRTPTAPNEVWAADFKGWFRTGDGKRCEPLTISDLASRYLLACRHVDRPDAATVRKVFTAVFRENGLPLAIRTDNGPPFASTGLGGLSQLSVWWVKLGIALERIEPGCPQQNGCHERMHRTLKAESACPPAATPAAQQRAFDRFLTTFNTLRPHESLGDRPPASFYVHSDRRFPERQPAMEYAPHLEVRRVRTTGEIKWRGDLVYLSTALVGEPVSLEQIDDRRWIVRFGPIALAYLDDASGKLLRIRPRARRRSSAPPASVENSARPSGSLRSPQTPNLS